VHRFLEATAGQYMTRKVKTVARDTTMRELHKMFEADNYNCYPVREGDDIVGVVSHRRGGGSGSLSLCGNKTMPARRFPPPWTVEEHRGISYIVRDANNFAVAYVYFESKPGRRASASLMTKDEARKIAAGIAELPELLRLTNH